MRASSLLLPVLRAVSAAAVCLRTVTVQSGDTCDALAISQGVSSYQINYLNNNGCSNLQIGQVLCLADTTYNCQPVYTVQPGDYCWGISEAHGISFDRLISNNPQLNPSSCPIYPGMTLCVSPTGPTTTTVPPTTTVSSTTTNPNPTPGTCTRSVTVQAGDTCDALAVAQGVSSYQINFLNNNGCGSLQIGQVLCLASTTYNCQPVYTVQPGNFCFGIADAHGITLQQFLASNPQLNADTCAIYPGMSVCVSASGGTSVAPGPSSTVSATPTPTPTGCTKYTTIKAGESCDLIAQRSQISNYDLERINPTISCANLIQGHAICVDAPEVDCSAVYIVDGSEGGCSNIASAHDITFSELRTLNPNINEQCTNIYIGQVLCVAPDLPAIPPVTGCTRSYTVVLGDTCPSIAAKNSLTSVQLLALNPNMNCNALAPGDTLCSFSPSLNICPTLTKIATGDSCFDVADRAEMSLVEFLSINPSLNCEALFPGNLVCTAQGNATLPTVPSGSNPTAAPQCGSYNRQQQCCSKFSVAADLLSYLCLRANGCQDNCAGDPGVVMPTAAATPTTTLTVTHVPTPTATPNCNSCTADECCSTFNTCEPSTSWYCETTNGCKSNCDHGAPSGAFAPGQVVFNPGNYTFPPGDYSATDGNPCGVCNAQKAGVTSASGNYCCTQAIQCLPIEYPACNVDYGCVYNCLDVYYQDPIACGNSGNCVMMTSTVKHPFATQTPA
ncbi:hypothetical protein CVT24_002621 [Panaeolus cyanescens]|uniref:LysM domain-containing protein n=1 Tax=Panaeolus cyanescens TaxID=181874 RepID=A0A409YTZ2_9AGAR|nr:hypothetical protein CVT24_002621 [Panaeolus cyanescens]